MIVGCLAMVPGRWDRILTARLRCQETVYPKQNSTCKYCSVYCWSTTKNDRPGPSSFEEHILYCLSAQALDSRVLAGLIFWHVAELISARLPVLHPWRGNRRPHFRALRRARDHSTHLFPNVSHFSHFILPSQPQHLTPGRIFVVSHNPSLLSKEPGSLE